MEPISLSDVVEAARGELISKGGTDLRIQGVSTDTRTIREGELFVPLQGENFDGHHFVDQALNRGAAAYLTEIGPVNGAVGRAPAIKVDSAIGAFMRLARYYRSRCDALVIGITGTNGKTTTKDLLGHVLSKSGPTVFSERSFNNFVGLPATIFRMEDDTRYAVLEMGTNRPGEIAALTAVASPEVGIVTNISSSHLDGLKDKDGILREKSALLEGLTGRRLAFLNKDDPAFDRLAEAAVGRVVTFSLCRRADYTATRIHVDFEGVAFEVNGVRLNLPLLGLHNIYNALSVFACAMELGVAPEIAAAVFEKFKGPPMRLVPILKGSLLVINDTYNANPGSMESAIKTFSVLPRRGRKVVILGDMLELADDSETLHRHVGEQLSCGDFDLVVAVGVRARNYLVGASRRGVPDDRLVSFKTTEEAKVALPKLLERDDSVLIKGSRKMELEKIVEAVLATDI